MNNSLLNVRIAELSGVTGPSCEQQDGVCLYEFVVWLMARLCMVNKLTKPRFHVGHMNIEAAYGKSPVIPNEGRADAFEANG